MAKVDWNESKLVAGIGSLSGSECPGRARLVAPTSAVATASSAIAAGNIGIARGGMVAAEPAKNTRA